MNSNILPSFTLCLTVNICILQCNCMNIMASHKEVSSLWPTWTSLQDQVDLLGIAREFATHCCKLFMPTTPLPETPVNPATVPSMPTTSPLDRSVLPDNTSHAVTDTSNHNSSVQTSLQDRCIEVLMPCMRQWDRFVDPKGKPLQSGTVLFVKTFPSLFTIMVKSIIIWVATWNSNI